MAENPFDLHGKVALVTGGNRGIGFGMAEALARAGADVVIWGSNADRNGEAAQRLSGLGVRILAQAVDVASEEAVTTAMNAAVEELGRLDFAVANAGVGVITPSLLETPTDTYRRVMGVNVDGVFWTLREACRHMIRRIQAGDPGGSVAAMGSMAATRGGPGSAAYSASKGAVISIIKAIAVEHAAIGLRANAIIPGWIETDMTAPSLSRPGFRDQIIARVPARKFGKPEHFGGLAVYLASDVSAYHTGDVLTIDGAYACSI